MLVLYASIVPQTQEALSVTRVSHALDRIEATFDDPNLVANAGLLLSATLSDRLGLEASDRRRRCALDGRVGGARPGRKVLTLAHSMCAGGSHIDHADMLRAGATAAVLGHRVMAPSTIGTFLRSFTFGHVRQLEAVNGHALERAWAAGAGPGDQALVIDIDSTICEVAGNAKQGAGYGYTHALGYHPILATRADTGEVLHARMRKGSANTQRGARRFIDEARRPSPPRRRHRRVDGAGRFRVLVQRHHRRVEPAERALHDGGALRHQRHRRRRSPRSPRPPGQTSTTPTTAKPKSPTATYTTGTGSTTVTRRLVVRRTRLTGQAQQRLWPDWRHHAFLTDLDGDAVERRQVPPPTRRRRARHPRPQRRRRTRTRPVRQLPRQLRLAAMRSPRPQPDPLDRASSATPASTTNSIVARTIRTRLLAIPGRLVNRAGRPTLRCPPTGHGPTTFTTALAALRAPATRHRLNTHAAVRPPAHNTQRAQPDRTRHPASARTEHRSTTSRPSAAARPRSPHRYLKNPIGEVGRWFGGSVYSASSAGP